MNQPVELVVKACEYAYNHNLKIVSLNKLNKCKDYYDYSFASIEDFLNLVKNAEVVFTTSFHGMAFSINFHRNFYFEVPQNSYNNNERLLDLATKLNLKDRNISLGLNEKSIEWEEKDDILDKLIRESLEYLDNSLK